MNITLDTHITRNSEVLFTTIGEEVFLMQIEVGKYFGLDPISSRIWNLIETPISINNLCALLISEYEISIDQCESDVLDLVKQTINDKLIQVVS